jgi:hypothetical protein
MFLSSYPNKAQLEDHMDKGYVKKLSKDEADQSCQRFHWFLPHFVVFHPEKPDHSCFVDYFQNSN